MHISVHSLAIILHGLSLTTVWLSNLQSQAVSIWISLDSKHRQQPAWLEEQQMAALIQLITQLVTLHLWISPQDTVWSGKMNSFIIATLYHMRLLVTCAASNTFPHFILTQTTASNVFKNSGRCLVNVYKTEQGNTGQTVERQRSETEASSLITF